MESPGSAPKGVRTAPMASQGVIPGQMTVDECIEEAARGYVVVIEVEYDARTEREARLRAHRDAEYLFQQPDVLAVTADDKKPADALFPITKAYLDSRTELA